MSGQNRILAMLLGVLAVLVLAVGGLSAVLLATGGGDDGDDGGGGDSSGGVSTGDASDGGGGTDNSGQLRLGSSDPVTLDPAIAGDALSAEYIVEIFGGLVTLDRELNIVPDIAESFEVSDDGTQYTFVLRDDARFHNTGRQVTAEDFKWSMERALSRISPRPSLSPTSVTSSAPATASSAWPRTCRASR